MPVKASGSRASLDKMVVRCGAVVRRWRSARMGDGSMSVYLIKGGRGGVLRGGVLRGGVLRVSRMSRARRPVPPPT